MWLEHATELNKVLICKLSVLPSIYEVYYIWYHALYLFILSFPDLETKASGLSTMSKKYHKDAQYLNMRSTVAKIAAGAVVTLVFLLYFFVFWAVYLDINLFFLHISGPSTCTRILPIYYFYFVPFPTWLIWNFMSPRNMCLYPSQSLSITFLFLHI